jgi:hypothetical protein
MIMLLILIKSSCCWVISSFLRLELPCLDQKKKVAEKSKFGMDQRNWKAPES